MKTNYRTHIPAEVAEKLDRVVRKRRLAGRACAAEIILQRFAGNLASTAFRGFAATEPYLEEEWSYRPSLELDQALYAEVAEAAKKIGVMRSHLGAIILVAHQENFDELIAAGLIAEANSRENHP